MKKLIALAVCFTLASASIGNVDDVVQAKERKVLSTKKKILKSV